MRCVRRSERDVREERLVRCHRMQVADVGDGLVDHVLGEVVAVVGGPPWLDRRGPLVEGRRPLIRLAADEAEEPFEPVAGRPSVERSGRAHLPRRGLVHLPERSGAVPVVAEHLGNGRHRVRADAVVARRTGRHLAHRSHAGRVVITSRQQRLAGRRTQRRRVEPVVGEAPLGDALHGRHPARTTHGAWRPRAHVVDEHDDHVRSARRGTQRLQCGELGVPGIERHLPPGRHIGNRKNMTAGVIGILGHGDLSIGNGATNGARRADRARITEGNCHGLCRIASESGSSRNDARRSSAGPQAPPTPKRRARGFAEQMAVPTCKPPELDDSEFTCDRGDGLLAGLCVGEASSRFVQHAALEVESGRQTRHLDERQSEPALRAHRCATQR